MTLPYGGYGRKEDAVLKERLAAIKATLSKHGQEHVLRWFDQLSEAERGELIEQVERLDFDEIERFRELVGSPNQFAAAGHIEPPTVTRVEPNSPEWRRARVTGQELLREGKVAVVMVAGGQGTRLGFDGPKGTFAITPVRNKTLFQLHAEKLQALAERFGRAIRWYVMTSPANDAATREFFERQRYFGLNREEVKFFVQPMVPALDGEGRLVMDGRAHVFTSPNGHGGTFGALLQTGMIDDMERCGVEEVFYFQVDNALVRVADAVFLGLHHQAGAQMSCKVCPRRDAFERVGVVALIKGRVLVVEYSDLSEEFATELDESGELRYRAGNIAIHVFRVDFVRRMERDGVELLWHVARKKVPCLDESGNRLEPDEPNAYKFERFIFDALPIAEEVVVMEVDRKEEFAPLKQLTGQDSVETAREAMVEQAARWLSAAGVDVPRDEGGSVKFPLEISPLVALEPQDLPGKIPPETVIDGPFYLSTD